MVTPSSFTQRPPRNIQAASESRFALYLVLAFFTFWISLPLAEVNPHLSDPILVLTLTLVLGYVFMQKKHAPKPKSLRQPKEKDPSVRIHSEPLECENDEMARVVSDIWAREGHNRSQEETMVFRMPVESATAESKIEEVANPVQAPYDQQFVFPAPPSEPKTEEVYAWEGETAFGKMAEMKSRMERRRSSASTVASGWDYSRPSASTIEDMRVSTASLGQSSVYYPEDSYYRPSMDLSGHEYNLSEATFGYRRSEDMFQPDDAPQMNYAQEDVYNRGVQSMSNLTSMQYQDERRVQSMSSIAEYGRQTINLGSIMKGGKGGQKGKGAKMNKVQEIQRKNRWSNLQRTLSQYLSSNQWARALKLVASAGPEDVIDTIDYNRVMKICGNARQWKHSLALFHAMESRGMTRSAVSFNTIISICGSARQWRHSLEIFREMVNEGRAPDVITVNSVLNACQVGEQWALGLELFHDMATNYTVDSLSCGTAISMCRNQRNWQEALRILESMEGRGIPRDIVSLSAAMDVCGKSGRPDITLELFDEVLASGIKTSIHTFMTAITAAGYANKPQRALDIFERIPDSGLKLDAGCYMVTIYAIRKSECWAKALDLFKRMTDSGFPADLVAYTSLINACNHGKAWESALRIFHEAQASGCGLDQRIYDSLLRTLVECKQNELTVAIVNRMLNEGFFPSKLLVRTLRPVLGREDRDLLQLLDQKIAASGMGLRM